MAGYSATPGRPNVANSVSLQQGFYSTPQGRGKTVEELNAMLPTFQTWEQAIAGLQGDDKYKTMLLQEAYGLPQSYEVKGGRIVSNDHSLRNGILGGTALIGGLSGLDAIVNGVGAGAAAGGTAQLGPWDTPTGMAGPALSGGPTLGSASVANGAGATAGAGAGSQLLDSVRNPRSAAALASLVGMLTTGSNGGGSGNLSSSPQVQSLLDSVTSRAKATDPLFQSINQLAMSRLPTSVQK